MEHPNPDPLVEETLQRSLAAAQAFSLLDQDATDRIVKAVYEAGFMNRWTLAELAHRETGIGIVHDKMVKNIIATRFVYRAIRDQKTVGVIDVDEEKLITEIAHPMGPVFAVTPVTNPTSTALFKILIALKTRNPIIVYPHGAARKCTIEAARICYAAALDAGAPVDCIQWIPRASRDQVIQFMSHPRTALVLATGSVSLVRAAYSSGNPAIGVGPGNVPVYIGKTADIRFAVEQILLSKLFDHGTICASEQSVVVSRANAQSVRSEFVRQGGYFLSPEETEKVGRIAVDRAQHTMSPEVIGRHPQVNAGRIVVNTPSSQGALGGIYNSLTPSLTLACGSGGKNVTTDNISVRHLLNIQRIAYRKVRICAEHQLGEAFCCDRYLTLEEIDRQCEVANNEQRTGLREPTG
jgi:acetaldehyde dehydrogenase/alcohol dehydrogenase